jgi:predicted nucleotidyltransferase
MKLQSTLGSLFPSMAMARLVVFFAVHPGERFHLRELRRRTGLSLASLQHELARMAFISALRREDEGNRSYYVADESHAAWRAWRTLLASSADPSDVLREVLVDASGIDGAFVFGSTARGEDRGGSDVDVLLLGSAEARWAAGMRLIEAELLIGRTIDVIGYETEEFAERERTGNTFVRRVLSEPRRWLRGDAASVPLPEPA